MTSAYEAIFYGLPYVSCILAGVAILSLFLQKQAIVARSIGFAFQLWIAPLFYFTYMAIVQGTPGVVIVALCVELIFLAVYLVLFGRLFEAVTTISPQHLPKMLRYIRLGTWSIALLTVPLLFQSGVGIFSSGSRNEYLAGSRMNIYLVYASALVQCAMIPIVAAIINIEKRWRRSVILYLVLISALSVLSASKGGVVLTLLAIASLLKFEHRRHAFRVLFVPVCSAGALIAITVLFVGQFLALEPLQMISLMFNRLFISNDGRALAIDWSGYMGYGTASLFRESFRLYASLLGYAPQYPPIGQLLYALRFGTEGFVGANASSTALLITYGSDWEKVLFALLLAGAAVVIAILADIPGRGSIPRLAIGIGLLSLLSQDFLAFQIWMNILVFLCAVIVVMAILIKVLRLASAPRAPEIQATSEATATS